MFDLFLCLNMNSEHINKAFDQLCTLMDDLNMCDESDILPSALERELAKNNLFSAYGSESPTDKAIRLLYDVAEEFIKTKYPNAEISRSVNGYDSFIKVDNTTYEKGLKERREAYFE